MKKQRPTSPHIQIYRPEFTSVSSIFHRLSGVFNVLGLIIISLHILKLAFWSNCPMKECNCELYNSAINVFMLLFIWSLYHHLFGGIRHFLLDVGIGFNIKQARIVAYSVFMLSFIATFITWLIYYNVI